MNLLKSVTRTEWMLALAGFCLMLLQFSMIREVTSLLCGTEMVILLVTVAYFLGYSVGYGAARVLPMERVRRLSLWAWLLHITLPFSLRYGGGVLYQVLPGAAFWALLFVTAFALSSFYSILLPRFIDQAADHGQSLVRCYAAELAGAVAGMGALFCGPAGPWVVPVVYQLALALLIFLLTRTPLRALAFAGVALYAAAFTALDRNSMEFHYKAVHGLQDPHVLSSVNTFYQKVDIVRDGAGTRYIFLNSREHFGRSHLNVFNQHLSEIPGRLLHPKNALVVGSGSMRSVYNLSQVSEHVTTAELDGAVVAASRKYFPDINHLDELKNWTLAIQDGKEFLGRTDQKFDLIVMDVPSPDTIGVAMVHSVEFYRLARERLNPHGVISVSLSWRFPDRNLIPQTVAAALQEAFREVVVIKPDGSRFSFAMASQSLPFTDDDLRRVTREVTGKGLELIRGDELARALAGIRPLSADNVTQAVRRSWDEVRQHYLRREE